MVAPWCSNFGMFVSFRDGNGRFFQLDLDEREFERVRIADVVLHPGRPKVRLARDQLVDRVTGRPGRRQPPGGEWHHDVGQLVTVRPGTGTRREAPLGHAHALVVDLDVRERSQVPGHRGMIREKPVHYRATMPTTLLMLPPQSDKHPERPNGLK